MIKAKELRVGNFVQFGNDTEWHEVEAISLSQNIDKPDLIHLTGNGITNRDEQIFGIPITEEWLLKFDFEKDKEKGRHGYRYSIGHQDFRYVMSKDWREETTHHFGIWYTDSPRKSDLTEVFGFTDQVQFVHQLQNLFFALTREELIISEK